MITKFKPDVLLVGIASPKHKKWPVKHKDVIKPVLVIFIENIFDKFKGNQKPVYSVWYKLSLMWLVRIFLRPEIFKRNIENRVAYSPTFYYCF